MRYSDVSVQSGKTHEALDKAIGEAALNEVKTKEFQFDERKKFEGKAKKASKGVKKWSGWSGALTGIAAVGLGMAALPAALAVGSATMIGGMIGKSGLTKSGRELKSMKKGKWFKSDQQDVSDSINKQLVTATISNAVMAGIATGSAGKATGGVGKPGVPTTSTGNITQVAKGKGQNVATTVAGGGKQGVASTVPAAGKPSWLSKAKTILKGDDNINYLANYGDAFTPEQFIENIKATGQTLIGGRGDSEKLFQRFQTGKTMMDWYNSDENKDNRYTI